MRDYYEKVLASTYMIFGVNQMEKMTDEQLQFLLDGLESISKRYSYIPEESQKQIIRTRLLRDREFKNINLNLIARWFEEDGKQFFTQQHHKERLTEQDYTPLEGEEREQAIQRYLDELAKVQINWANQDVKGSGSKMREQLERVAPKTPESESALNEFLTQKANAALYESPEEGTRTDSEEAGSEINPPQ